MRFRSLRRGIADCYLGRQSWSAGFLSLDHYLKNVDVLVPPAETILTRAEVGAIVQKYDPKAVIPAHYFLSGLTTDTSGLESADGWVK
jgi:hypothetical protein